MARKIALYLDTSLPNALFQKPEDRKEVTSQTIYCYTKRFS